MRRFQDTQIIGAKIAHEFQKSKVPIELRCVDTSLPVLSESYPPINDYISADWSREWLEAYQSRLHHVFAQMIDGSTLASSTLLGGLLTLDTLSRNISVLKTKVKHLLGATPGSFGLVNTFHEDFSSLVNTETNSVDLVDTQLKGVSPKVGAIYNLKRKDITTTISSENGTFQAQDIPLGQGPDQRTFVVAKQVYQTRPTPVSIECKAYLPIGKEYRYIEIRLPADNGIEEITLEAELMNGERELLIKQELTERTLTVIAPATIRSFIFTLTSTKIDGVDNTDIYHLFIVSEILVAEIPPFEEKTYYSKPIQFDSDSAFSSVRLKAMVGGPSHLVPTFQVSGLKTTLGTWTDWKMIKPDGSQLVYLGSIGRQDNTSSLNEQLVIPYLASTYARVDWSPGLYQIDGQFQIQVASDSYKRIDPSSIVVLRQAGSKDQTSTNPTNMGWRFEYGLWYTHVFIKTSLTVDFGPHTIQFDGSKVKGIVTFEEGIHTIGVHPDSWQSISTGLTGAEAIAADAYYPYNCRYIIQGYPNVAEYQGVGHFGAYVGRYVAPEVLMFKKNYDPQLFSFYFDSSLASIVPIVMIENDFNMFYNEKVLIWFDAIWPTHRCSEIKFRIQFQPTNVVGSFVKSYTAMVV